MSIKAHELRIGNWLKRSDDTLFEVTASDIHLVNDLPEYLRPKPIPLTPEILGKCGFLKSRDNWYFINYSTDCNELAEYMCIRINTTTFRCAIYDEESDGSPSMTGMRIKSLHQLQNLY
jgi:hypothetical protein